MTWMWGTQPPAWALGKHDDLDIFDGVYPDDPPPPLDDVDQQDRVDAAVQRILADPDAPIVATLRAELGGAA